jgi:alkyldihydroxyacetonephosphate synthase
VTRLAEVVGATHVSAAPADVDAYGGLDPALVVWPGAASEVARVLKTCTELNIAVGVSASGTRATGHWPVQGERPRVALDTRRMLNILEVDELSLTVHSQCGIKLRHLEEALNQHGLTLGPFPPWLLRHTLGGILAAPHPAAHSPQIGWLTEACMGVSVAHADGMVMHTRVAPRKATGPDVSRLYLGSRGALGVITTAVLKVYRQPEHEVVMGHFFADFATAVEGARAILASGVRPARLRLLGSEQALQELGEASPELSAVVLVVLAGAASLVAAQQRIVDDIFGAESGTPLPPALGSRWWARHSVGTEPEKLPVPVGARLRFSKVAEAVDAVPASVGRKRVLMWADELDRGSLTLWFALRGASDPAALRSLLLDAGLDPLRLNFPPLFDELRQQLDPTQTLVVMEA